MWKKLLNKHLTFRTIFVKRSVNVQSNFDLGNQMKLLNNKKQFEKSLELFDKYKEKNIEKYSSLIITQALKASTQLNDLQRGLTIHKLISSRLKSDHYILASLIHFYMQCGDINNAQLLFDGSTKKTLSMYGSMMKGYIKNNQANKAIHLFNEIKSPDEMLVTFLFNACAQMKNNEALNLIKKVFKEIPKSFHSDFLLINSLFDALIKCDDCSAAEIIFSKMRKCLKSYGNLMSGFIKENNPLKTLELFNQMKNDNIKADLVIYLCVIKALSQIVDYLISQSIVKQIPKSFLSDYRIQTALIDMWGKTGSIDQAKEIFLKISQPDHMGYTAMINCYGLNGMGIQAIEIFRQMPQKLINEVTYVCVLNACSHSGLVDEARSIFKNIQIKTEKIYTTIIDCLSRASLFQEAQNLIDEYEDQHLPSVHIYTTLLSCARNQKNSHLSEKVYNRMKNLFPELKDPLVSSTILFANVYASSGDIDKASNIRIQLSKSGLKKQVSLSWTAVNGQIFQFRAHDQSHPRSHEIYAEIDKISKELIEHGYVYDSSWITRPLNQDETVESVLCGHSERLAIAWNFVENPSASQIQVTNNLRICGDCHRAIKLIALIRQCDIIVRDANRIHHFHTNGQCSCNDYF